MAYSYVAIVVAVVASIWCWWHIRRSGDPVLIKVVLALIAAVPFVGALIYVLVQLPPRRHPEAPPEGAREPSAFVKHWHEHEGVYLGWTSAVFWALAVLAYWINGWSPGRVFAWRHGHYTEVDVIFHALLVGAVLTFGLALRAKVVLLRELKGAAAHVHPRYLETQ